MRILIISPWENLSCNGTPSLYKLVNFFLNFGYKVDLICPFSEKNVFINNLSVHRFKLPFKNFNSKIRIINLIFSKFVYFLFIILSTWKSIKTTRRNKPDIVYGLSSFGAIPAYIVGKINNVPNITRLYGTFLYPFINNYFQLLLRFEEVISFKIPCKYLIITDDGTRGDEVAKKLKINNEKIKFWRNGVDDIYKLNFDKNKFKEKIDISNNKKIILSVSRLVKWKRVDKIIKVMPFIVSKFKDVILLVVGEGEERDYLESLVSNLDLKKNVKFIGAVSHEKIYEYINSADIFASMYDLTNVGNPLLEAMICGRCIITKNVGGTGDIIKNNYNGILLERDDVEVFSDVITSLLKDEEQRKRLGYNARNFALKNLQNWNERILMEIKLLENIKNIKKNDNR